MNLEPIHPSPTGADTLREDKKLQQACRDFEGFFLSIILKEGMRPGFNPEGESSAESGATLQEYAVEQVAYNLGATGSMGLSNLLYDHMVQHMPRTTEDTP